MKFVRGTKMYKEIFYGFGNYVGKEGLAVVNLGLPIVYFYLAIGLMIAVGGTSIAGRLLGANEVKEANQVFRQSMMICFIVTMTVVLKHSLRLSICKTASFWSTWRCRIYDYRLCVLCIQYDYDWIWPGNGADCQLYLWCKTV